MDDGFSFFLRLRLEKNHIFFLFFSVSALKKIVCVVYYNYFQNMIF